MLCSRDVLEQTKDFEREVPLAPSRATFYCVRKTVFVVAAKSNEKRIYSPKIFQPGCVGLTPSQLFASAAPSPVG